MATHLVTYDLLKPGQNYDNLIAHMKTYPGIKIQLSAWIIVSDLSAPQIHAAVTTFLDANDKLFVLTTSRLAAWSSLGKPIDDWLVANL